MSPGERHPIDVRADEVRLAEVPRQSAADGIDEILGEWSMSGLATPPETILDHVRTLIIACLEEEKARALAVRLTREPVAEPWRELA